MSRVRGLIPDDERILNLVFFWGVHIGSAHSSSTVSGLVFRSMSLLALLILHGFGYISLL